MKESSQKHRSLVELHETLAQNKKLRRHEFRQSQRALHEVLAGTPTYQMLEDCYRHSVELPELQRRKEALALKRELMSPINMHALGQHSKQYSCSLKELSQKRAQRFRRRKLSLAAHEASLNYYTPKVTAILQAEQQQARETCQLMELQKEILREKGRKYGQLAKEVFKPLVSPAKRQAVQHSIEKFPNARSTAAPVATKRLSLARKPHYDWAFSARKQVKRAIKRVPPTVPESPTIFDYLNERRRERESAKKTGTFQLQDYHWRQVVQDPLLNSSERLGQLSKKARKLENQARSCEYLLGDLSLHDVKSIEANEIVTNAYLHSVNAKLALLNSYAS